MNSFVTTPLVIADEESVWLTLLIHEIPYGIWHECASSNTWLMQSAILVLVWNINRFEIPEVSKCRNSIIGTILKRNQKYFQGNLRCSVQFHSQSLVFFLNNLRNQIFDQIRPKSPCDSSFYIDFEEFSLKNFFFFRNKIFVQWIFNFELFQFWIPNCFGYFYGVEHTI